MKRLLLAVLILCATVGAAIWNTQRLDGFTSQMISLISQAGQAAGEERWEDTSALLDQAQTLWEGNTAYLHVTLRHADIDAITLSLSQLRQYTLGRDGNQWRICASNLSLQLQLLSEMEALTLKNVF